VKDFYRHLFFDKVKSLGIDSCLYDIPKNDLVDDMKLWPPVTSPYTCTVTSSKRRETSLGKSWKHTTLWFLGGSSHYSGVQERSPGSGPGRNPSEAEAKREISVQLL